MSQNAIRFLVELSQDPVKMEDYWKDPDSLLSAADLTAGEREILRSGDPERLETLFGPFITMGIGIKPHPKPKPRPKPKPASKPAPKPAPKPKPKAKPKSRAA